MRKALLAAVLLAITGCSAPPDANLHRPKTVPATRFEQRDILVDGMRLRYIDVPALHGDRKQPPILLIHGHTSRIEEYDELAAALRDHWRVLVFDLPGSGYSDKPVRDYDLRFYEDVILAFLDRLHIPRAYLVGGSQGGNLVLRLGYREPERFERLVAWAPGSAWPARPWVAALMRAADSYPLFWPIVKVQSTYWYRSDWPMRQEMLDRTFAYYKEVMCEGFVRMYFGMAADQVGRSLFDIAPSIRSPTLLMWGDQDHGANMGEGVKTLHDLIPRDELHIFPNAGHALASEIPGPLAEAIDEFLGRAPAQLP